MLLRLTCCFISKLSAKEVYFLLIKLCTLFCKFLISFSSSDFEQCLPSVIWKERHCLSIVKMFLLWLNHAETDTGCVITSFYHMKNVMIKQFISGCIACSGQSWSENLISILNSVTIPGYQFFTNTGIGKFCGILNKPSCIISGLDSLSVKWGRVTLL